MDKAQNIIQRLNEGHIPCASFSVHANDDNCFAFLLSHTKKGFVKYDNQSVVKVKFSCKLYLNILNKYYCGKRIHYHLVQSYLTRDCIKMIAKAGANGNQAETLDINNNNKGPTY